MLISIEGIDGSGKSTLAKELSRDGLIYVARKNPKISSVAIERTAEMLNNLVWNTHEIMENPNPSKMYWVHLIAAWYHFFEVTTIKPLMEQDVIVIVDGWWYKTIAQMHHLLPNADLDYLFSFCKPADLIILLDIDPCMAVKRKKELNIFECNSYNSNYKDACRAFIDHQSHVRFNYLKMRQDNWLTIDASKPLSEVLVSVRNQINKKVLLA